MADDKALPLRAADSQGGGRYALYYVPDEHSELYRRGAALLGRCVYGACALPRPALPGLPEELLLRHSLKAALYGLHGTIVAPFETADDEADLIAAAARIAASTEAFELRQPQLVAVNNIFAAVASEDRPEALWSLERRCLEEFNRFRLPLTAKDIARRGPLSPRHLANLRRWGYHLVLDDFNFHITIADSLPDPAENFLEILKNYLAPALTGPLMFDRLGLFYQPSRSEPFICRKVFLLKDYTHEH